LNLAHPVRSWLPSLPESAWQLMVFDTDFDFDFDPDGNFDAARHRGR